MLLFLRGQEAGLRRPLDHLREPGYLGDLPPPEGVLEKLMKDTYDVESGLATQVFRQFSKEVFKVALSYVTDVLMPKGWDEIVPDVGLDLLEVRSGNLLSLAVLSRRAAQAWA
jgi:hypothetical protein